MNSARAEKLLQYDYWANSRIISTLESVTYPADGEVIITLSHIVGAKQIWYNRIMSIPSGKELMNSVELEILKKSNDTLRLLWSDLIHKHDPAEKLIKYENFSGESFSSLLSDIITHVVNHGTYHRGQIARILREKGFTPPSTDYIVFSRL
jgi:uncharacterized damage-inducible protein DinB